MGEIYVRFKVYGTEGRFVKLEAIAIEYLNQNLDPAFPNGGVSVITEEFLKNGCGRCGYKE